MRILLTNDDGIRAPGILAMHDALTRGAPRSQGPLRSAANSNEPTCLVVAPLTVQSATSHGITFHTPLMMREEVLPHPHDLPGTRDNATGFGVDGRPADCVKLAVSSIWPQHFGAGAKPDLLISGVNAGANCGINVIYSGTVAAAIEGAFLGIPSIALSLRLGTGKVLWDLAAARARYALDAVLASGGPKPYEILSINIPATEDRSAKTKGGAGWSGSRPQERGRFDPSPAAAHDDPTIMPPIRVCPMNVHGLIDKYERRESPLGDTYFWAAGHGLDFHATEPGSDVDLLMQGYITMTPLKFDLTDHALAVAWKKRLG